MLGIDQISTLDDSLWKVAKFVGKAIPHNVTLFLGLTNYLKLNGYELDPPNCSARQPSAETFSDVATLNKRLDYFVAQGFYLHGSTREIIGNLLPHRASDTVKKDGNLEAIYLTRRPKTAQFKAIFGGIAGESKDSVQSIEDDQGNTISQSFTFAHQYPDKGAKYGYIYVLSPVGVTQLKNDKGEPIKEYVSYKPKTPVAIIGFPKEFFTDKVKEIKVS